MFQYPFFDTSSKRWLWSVIILIFVSSFGTKGMFVDGLTYANIARNWLDMEMPLTHYMTTPSLHNPFLGHPPMAFWLQSLFFSIGDFFWIDRAYSLFTFLVQLFLIQRMWNSFMSVDAQHNPMPLILFLSMPLVHWSYTNNMLENTMSMFTLLAVYSCMKGIQDKLKLRYILLYILCLVAGALTKGPVAAFPLAAPFFCLFAFGFRKLLYTIAWYVLTTIGIGLVLALFLNTSNETLLAFRNYIIDYIVHQVIYSLNLQSEEANQTFIISQFFLIILIPLSITIVIRIFARKLPIMNAIQINRGKTIFWIFMAFSASIPIAISPKQAECYLIPSLPFVALAFASLCYPFWTYLQNRLPKKQEFTFKVLSWNLLIVSICVVVFRWGSYNRDQETIELVDAVSSIVGEGETIRLAYTLNDEWSLRLYAYRYHYIDLKPTDEIYPYYLTKDKYQINTTCQIVANLGDYNLCQCEQD